MVDREDVAGGNGGFAAAEDVLAGVGSFGCQEVFRLLLVLVRISEVHLYDGTVSSRIVADSSDHTSNVALSLRVVEVTISSGSDSFALGGGKNTAFLSLPLAYVNKLVHLITLPIDH